MQTKTNSPDRFMTVTGREAAGLFLFNPAEPAQCLVQQSRDAYAFNLSALDVEQHIIHIVAWGKPEVILFLRCTVSGQLAFGIGFLSVSRLSPTLILRTVVYFGSVIFMLKM